MDELNRDICARIDLYCDDCGHTHSFEFALTFDAGCYGDDPSVKISFEFGDDRFQTIRLNEHYRKSLEESNHVHDLAYTDQKIEITLRTLVDLGKLVIRKPS